MTSPPLQGVSNHNMSATLRCLFQKMTICSSIGGEVGDVVTVKLEPDTDKRDSERTERGSRRKTRPETRWLGVQA